MSQSEVLHATALELKQRALVLTGPAGSGKSDMALALIALGARLIADDRTIIAREGERLFALCPEPIAGRIEARGLGLIDMPHAAGPIPVAAIVDLSTQETERLPPFRKTRLLGLDVPLLHNSGTMHFAAALIAYMRHGRSD